VPRDLLHDRHGAFADQRDRQRVGAHAVASGAAGSVAGDGEGERAMMGLVLVVVLLFASVGMASARVIARTSAARAS
jgi:hypothetical protein